jgi:hypothetical protein
MEVKKFTVTVKMKAVPNQSRTEKRNRPSTKNASDDRVNRRPAQGEPIVAVNYPTAKLQRRSRKFHLLLNRTKGSLKGVGPRSYGECIIHR